MLVFDLYAGGAPRRLRWPAGLDVQPWALCAAPGGGAWVLDRRGRLLRLDRHFELARELVEPPPGPGSFVPADDSAPTRQTSLRVAEPITLPGALDPVAVAADSDGTLFVLDRGTPDATLLVVRDGTVLQRLSTAALRDVLQADAGFRVAVYDMAYVEASQRLLLADAGANQAWAFELGRDRRVDGSPWALTPLPDYLPLRRFGGKGLGVAPDGQVRYDFADSWVPLVSQAQPRHAEAAWLRTPVFDGREPQCVWHRVFVDGAVPPACRLRVWSRVADDAALLDGCPWLEEPQPYRRGDGSELPLRPPPPAPVRQGEGTWELLLQHARGRFLQLRLRLEGNQRHSPRLAALRVYYPRFSYLERYLPALYRDDAGGAAFLEGFLANLEGFYTTIEDRIAAAGALFDARSAPPETLDWLAGWLGVALDPAWDTERRRLFIRHAMLFFQYRGTAHGLALALSLALDETLDESRFDQPGRAPEPPFGVRLIERYRTRRLPDVLLGDPAQLENLGAAATRPWTPADGGRRLLERYLKASAPFAEPPTSFPLVPPVDPAAAAAWAALCEAALGFTPFDAALERRTWQDALAARYVDVARLNAAWPATYADFDSIELPLRNGVADWAAYARDPAPARTPVERLAWQAFLRSRYTTTARLNAAWTSDWAAFDLVPVPDRLPPDGPALVDWFQFESAVLAMRASAHRFTVLLPMPADDRDTTLPQRQLELARRIVALEKPAHTVFDLRFYWAMFRVGAARLGRDTVLDSGTRARLMSPFVLGRGYLGQDYVAPTTVEALRDGLVPGRDRLGSGELR